MERMCQAPPDTCSCAARQSAGSSVASVSMPVLICHRTVPAESATRPFLLARARAPPHPNGTPTLPQVPSSHPNNRCMRLAPFPLQVSLLTVLLFPAPGPWGNKDCKCQMMPNDQLCVLPSHLLAMVMGRGRLGKINVKLGVGIRCNDRAFVCACHAKSEPIA